MKSISSTCVCVRRHRINTTNLNGEAGGESLAQRYERPNPHKLRTKGLKLSLVEHKEEEEGCEKGKTEAC